MRVSDYIASWIATVNPRVYAVCGAGAMHLNDAICNHPGVEVMAMHHEQACTFAAEADARVSGRPGIVMVTAGPGGTNAVTGIACAFVDSIPMIVIAGQVTAGTMKPPHMRQLGLNELDGTKIVSSITKRAWTVTDPMAVPSTLAEALHEATDGKPGPVWIEVPLDVQCAEIPDQPVIAMSPQPDLRCSRAESEAVSYCTEMLRAAKRPVLIIGNGVREARGCLTCFGMPIISSWGGADIVDNAHPLYIGRMGLFGDRASNYAVQHADLILAVGTRLSVAQIGHHPQLFAPEATKIVVDVDAQELTKPTTDVGICSDAALFCEALLPSMTGVCWPEWHERLRRMKIERPTMLPEYREETSGVNAYYFVEEINKRLADDAVVVTDVGVAFIATHQTLRLNGRQRLIHSGGVSPMGWGLSAAIGACRASGGRQTVCLAGDGGMMVNIQELQTVAHHLLPLITFVFVNNGYFTIQAMQKNHFNRLAISSPESGLSCPEFREVGHAFGLPTFEMFTNDDVKDWMDFVMSRKHPVVCVVKITENQVLLPRVQSRLENGKFVPTALDEMFPPWREPAMTAP